MRSSTSNIQPRDLRERIFYVWSRSLFMKSSRAALFAFSVKTRRVCSSLLYHGTFQCTG
jgi:hypothetical protein